MSKKSSSPYPPRAEKDRRNYKRIVTFPLILSNGTVIPEDRRINPDRRLSGVSVEYIEGVEP
jgi:hypothetical protein